MISSEGDELRNWMYQIIDYKKKIKNKNGNRSNIDEQLEEFGSYFFLEPGSQGEECRKMK